MKILIYGSTYITQLVVEHLSKGFHNPWKLVGYIPSSNPTFPGKLYLPLVDESVPHDIKLSIQYDEKIHADNAYNLHTGLLPEYGGCNILYHTIKNGAKEQGLTFHKITKRFDEGEIICRGSYPVLKSDEVSDLYHKMAILAPLVAEMGLRLLPATGLSYKPTLYRRADIDPIESERQINEIENYIRENHR